MWADVGLELVLGWRLRPVNQLSRSSPHCGDWPTPDGADGLVRMLDDLRASLVPTQEEALRSGCYRRTKRSSRWPGVGHRTDGSPIMGERETWMLGGAPVALATLLQLIEAGVVQEAALR
jgi:hypothetical protein